MADLLSNCGRLTNLNDITQNINMTDSIENILDNIFTETQQYYGPSTSNPVECHLLSLIYKCILTSNGFTLTRYDRLPELNENQVAILMIIPPVNIVEYHFLLIYPISDTDYRIYSANGNKFITPFNISKVDFNRFYNILNEDNAKNTKYPDNVTDVNSDISEIPITIAWNSLTNDNLQESFNELFSNSGDNDEDEDEDDDDDEDDNERKDSWERYINLRNSALSSIQKPVWVLTRQQGSSKKKRRTKRRKTNKRRKTSKKKSIK